MHAFQQFLVSVAVAISSLFAGGSASPVPTPINQPEVIVSTIASENLASLEELGKKAGKVRYSVSQSTGKLTYLASEDNKIIFQQTGQLAQERTVYDFFEQYGNLFGIMDPHSELKLVNQTSTKTDVIFNSTLSSTTQRSPKLGTFQPGNITHLRYQQLYRNVPVYAAQVLVHLSQNNILSVQSGFVPDINIDTASKINRFSAQQTIGDSLRNQLSSTVTINYLSDELIVLDTSLIFPSRPKEHKIAWLIEATTVSEAGRGAYLGIVDAVTGQLIQLRSTHLEISRLITDCENNLECPNWPETPALTEDSDPIDNATQPGKLFNLLGQAHNYYLDNFDLNGPNGKGGTGTGRTHTGGKTSTDITYGYVNISLIGVGSSYADSYSVNIIPGHMSPDVVHHEYNHLVHMNLIPYSVRIFQNASLMEAFADIFGDSVSSRDWKLQDETGYTIRNMSDPPAGPNSSPDRLFSHLYRCDLSRPHINGGVINKAAYLMSEGGDFNSCSIPGIGREKMLAIMYQTMENYLTSSANFRDLFDGVRQSCGDLYESGSDTCKSVVAAMQAVEIDQQEAGRLEGSKCSDKSASPANCIALDSGTPTVDPTVTLEIEPTATPSSVTVTPFPSPTPIDRKTSVTGTQQVDWVWNDDNQGRCWNAWAESSCSLIAHEGGASLAIRDLDRDGKADISCSRGDGARYATTITNISDKTFTFRCERYQCSGCVSGNGTHAQCDGGIDPTAERIFDTIELKPKESQTCGFDGIGDVDPPPKITSTPTPADEATPTPADEATPTPADEDPTPTPADEDPTPTPADEATPTPTLSPAVTLAITPTPTPTPTPEFVTRPFLEIFLVGLINLNRRLLSMQPLNRNSMLNSAAQSHSLYLATNNACSHAGKENSTIQDRVRNENYTGTVTEILVCNTVSLQAVIARLFYSTNLTYLTDKDKRSIGISWAQNGAKIAKIVILIGEPSN